MKLSILIRLLFCTFFCNISLLQAQSPCEELPLPQEHITMHLDRNICLAGETIWFNAWCFLDGQLEEEMSKVLYVEIFDENQKVIVQEKYVLDDNKAAGSFRIPEDVPGRYYFLKAYTRYMRNFSPTAYHYQPITIVNPFMEGGKITAAATSSGAGQEDRRALQSGGHTADQALQIMVNKEKYQARQAIRFEVNSPNPIAAELSVVVRLKGLGNEPVQQLMRQNACLLAACQEDPFCRQYLADDLRGHPANAQKQQYEAAPDSIRLQWLPETRGLTISGLVQNDEQKAITGVSAMVAVLQEAPFLYTGITDEHGAFSICLQDMQGQKNLFAGTASEKHTIRIRNDFDPRQPEITTLPLQFDTSLHRLLESLNLHQQIKRIYPGHKTQPVFQPQPLHIASSNILTPDRRIVLSDYIELSTMAEVFREITPGVLLRKVEGKERLSVFNTEQQRQYDSPLILLDHIPVFNIPELLKIDPAKVEAVEIYDSDYILGDYTIGAIIAVISKTEDFAAYQWGQQAAFTSFKAFTASQAFEQVIHPGKSHYPDFRPVLYWQPELLLEPQQPSQPISIFAPDRPGVYEIVVQGFTRQGAACLGYTTFAVE